MKSHIETVLKTDYINRVFNSIDIVINIREREFKYILKRIIILFNVQKSYDHKIRITFPLMKLIQIQD